MSNIIPLIATGLVAGLSLALPAQEPTPSMRLDAQQVYLDRGVTVDLGSARQAFTEILRSTQRTGGMIILAGCGEPVQSPFATAPHSSLATALDLLTATYPDYAWTSQGGTINLLPNRKSPEAMDIRVPHVEWDTTATVSMSIAKPLEAGDVRRLLVANGYIGVDTLLTYATLLQRPPRVVNGVPEPPPPGRKFLLDNATVLSALNAVVASYESAMWLYEQRTCDGKTTYQFSSQDLRRSK